MIAILQALMLGVIEGLTEFLPISSTGHLIVAEHVIGYKDASKLFTVVVQLGAMAAVLWFYRQDIISRISSLFGRKPGALNFWIVLFCATVPAGILGLLFDDAMQTISVPLTVAVCLIGGGIILWLVDHQRPETTHAPLKLDAISPKQAFIIGLSQATALVPGISRSGAAIVGGMASGLNRVTATAFSFYMGLPILGLAGAYKLIKEREQIQTIPGGAAALAVGTLAAAVTAFIVVSWLLGYVSKHNFKGFALYRIGAGVVLLLLIATTSL